MSYTSGSQSQDSRGDDVFLDLRCATHDTLRAAIEVGTEQIWIVDAAHCQRSMAYGLLDPGHQQLVQRSVRGMGHAVELLGQPPPDVVSQHLGLYSSPSEFLIRRAVGACGQLADQLAVARRVAQR